MKINRQLKISKSTTLFLSIVVCIVVLLLSCACAQNTANVSISNTSTVQNTGIKTFEGYSLEQVTILSRHNIRAANTDTKPDYRTITPNEWIDWTANSGELGLQGGEEETLMGQYFRKFLASQNFMPENWIPSQGEAYFFSNSNQRTIATTHFFATGMLPAATTPVTHNFDIGTNDPIFRKALSIDNENFRAKVKDEITKLNSAGTIEGFDSDFKESYKILDNILDFKDSEYAHKNDIESISEEKTEVEIKNGAKPNIKGPLLTATSGIDALRLQYYMNANDKEALFGKNTSFQDLQKISYLEDVFLKAQYGTPTGSIDIANPTLIELKKQMEQAGRKFSFICGHDTTIIAVLNALKVCDYELPNAIEHYAPIGSKFLIQKFKNKNGEEFCNLSIVYASVDQLRNQTIISLDNPPMEVQLDLKGLQKNSNGLYKYSDVMQRFNESIEEYNKLLNF